MENRLYILRGKLTQREMAAKLGVSQQLYHYYETGAKGLKSDVIEKISAYSAGD